ncbi:MAG: HNH endonuclease [Chloroflexi bacterium]|nr:HNH endonuclease [Chloroflexota bacterium]
MARRSSWFSLAVTGVLAAVAIVGAVALVLLLVSADSGATAADAGEDGFTVIRPDPRLTPGDVFPVGTDVICVTGYTKKVRNVPAAVRREVLANYNFTAPSGTFEVDHLIPLELGGSNDIKNLWPEPEKPAPGSLQKDRLENRLNDLVCSGKLDLATAQQAIAADWYAAYKRYVLER